MRQLITLTLALWLAACTSAPQQALYNAEYSTRMDIRQHSLYRFMTRPVKPSGERYWGSGNLAELFYVTSDKAAAVELRFDYSAKSLQVSSLDVQGQVLRQQTFPLLDESEAPPSGTENLYFYLTKDGRLLFKGRNCTPDMSVGCRWWQRQVFLTRHADLGVQVENGSAGMLFLLVPFYGTDKQFEIFHKVP